MAKYVFYSGIKLEKMEEILLPGEEGDGNLGEGGNTKFLGEREGNQSSSKECKGRDHKE